MHGCAATLGGKIERQANGRAWVKWDRDGIGIVVSEMFHTKPSLLELADPPRELPDWHRYWASQHGELDGWEHQIAERVARIWCPHTQDLERLHSAELAALKLRADRCLLPAERLEPPSVARSPRIDRCRRALGHVGITDLALRSDYVDGSGGRFVADTLYSAKQFPRLAVSLFRARRWATVSDGWITVRKGDRTVMASRRSVDGEAEIDIGDGTSSLDLLQKGVDTCLSR